MNSASPDARESVLGGGRRVGGQLGGPRELAGGSSERAGLLAFERERPGGEDAGTFAGGMRDRGGVAASRAELLADALKLHRAPMPDQRALLELGLSLGRRPRGRRRRRLPLADGALACLLVLAPAAPQFGEREVAGEPTAAVPDSPPRTLIGAGESDGVADDHVGAALGVPGPVADALIAKPADELALVAAGGRTGPHDPLQRLPTRMLWVLAVVAKLSAAAAVRGELAVLEPATAGLAGARLEPAQPEALLELPAGGLGARAVVVDAGLAAVLGHQGDNHVGVV